MATLLYMGRSCEFLGTSREDIDLPDDVKNSEDLRLWLEKRSQHKGLFLESSIRISINHEIKQEPCAVSNNDEIAFLPPVGGG